MNIQPHLKLEDEANFVERALIDLAGIRSGMLIKNFVSSAQKLKKFNCPSNGLPILIPLIPEMFVAYEKFDLPYERIKRLIFGSVPSNYIGCRLSLNRGNFLKRFTLNSQFQKKLDTYTREILLAQKRIQELINEFGSVGAFQTRNIPHLGHEKIIDKMLEQCELVVINPMVGPKKFGDIDCGKLRGLYDSVMKPRYKNKIHFIPIRANMFYAGPREAIHHAKLREWLGFTHFSIGRDHAGAEGVYKNNAAIEMTRKYENNLSIKIITHGGAYHCSACRGIVLHDDCNHSKEYLTEISGSEFRQTLKIQKHYSYAANDVQNWVFKNHHHLNLSQR